MARYPLPAEDLSGGFLKLPALAEPQNGLICICAGGEIRTVSVRLKLWLDESPRGPGR